MNTKIDMVGKRFGMLLVLEQTAHKYGRINWLCQCDCGNVKAILGESIRSGASRSCGCQSHGNNYRHGFSGTPEYHAWMNMLSRCLDPSNKSYQNYGKRGISVCERWMLLDNFISDMGKRPPKLSLERRENDKGYYPANCYWASREEQNNNRRSYRKRERKL